MKNPTRACLLISALALAVPVFAQDKPAEKPKDGIDLPIKPTRKIEFTTQEVTWASLDLSPDGKTIVFELLGDLYTMPIEGGEAKLLVGGHCYDGMPRFSPDGKKLVFVSDRSGADNLWICNADGTDLKAVSQGRGSAWLSPAFTPDGNYVMGSKGMNYLPSYSLQMFDLRGGSGLGFGPPGLLPGTLNDNLVARPGPSRYGIQSSADGKYFYFAERKGPWQYDQANGGQSQVFRMDRVLGKIEIITSEDGGAMRPVLSPDGKSMLYFTRFRNQTGLKSMELSSGDTKWVAYPVDRDEMEGRATRDFMPGYAFTPDGKSIVLGLNGKIQRMSLSDGKATNIPFKAKVSQTIGEEVHFKHKIEDSPTVKAKIARSPVLSPDRSTVAFVAFGKIWLKKVDSGQATRLTNSEDSEFSPSWSPDGSRLTYSSWNAKKGGSINVVSADGSGRRAVTSAKAYYGNPIFTPDGRTILFTSTTYQRGVDTAVRIHGEDDELEAAEIGRGPRYSPVQLRIIPASGGEAKFLMNVPGSYFFLKDPERLYVRTGAGLVSMRLDGTDTQEIVKFSGTSQNSGAGNIALSPDGTKALVDIDFKLYSANIPFAGQAVTIGTPAGSVPVKKVAQDGGDDIAWTADGSGFFWARGNKAYIQEQTADKPKVIELSVEMPRHMPKGNLLLRGARLITMNGDEIINSGDILIVNNRISKIGKRGSFEIPAGTKIMPMDGKTISPGYVDTHSHWFGNRETAFPMSWAYLTNLAYGVTTNRDPQSGGDTIYDFADAIDAGMAPGPRIYTTGPGVFNGSGTDDKDTILANLRRYKDAYDTKTIKEYVSGDRMVIEWVAMACKELGLTPTTEGALETKRYLAEASAGYSGHEHAFPHALYDDMAQFIARTKTYYTPTLLVTYGGIMGENYWFSNYDLSKEKKVQRFVPVAALDEVSRRRPFWALEEEYFFKQVAESCNKVVEAGGKVGVGCHGQFQGLGNHWDMWMLAQGGMKPHNVLRCATIFGAEAIGLDGDLGSLEPGKLADLIIYDKNPLENIRNTNTIHWVMKNGELFDSESMDAVWPVAKKLPEMYWDTLRPPFLAKP